MDVTSLLNAASAAQVERRDSLEQATTPSIADSTTPATTPISTPEPEKTSSRRNSVSKGRSGARTPWDAGGYSLPLSLDTKYLPTSAKPSFYFTDSPLENIRSVSPKSPKHRCSDSQSSLSSFTSSTNSMTHSRISSLSTVSEFQPLGSVLTDLPPEKSPLVFSATSYPTTVEVSPPSPVVEEEITKDNEFPTGSDGSSKTIKRPQSPSDAILFTRPFGDERQGSQDSVGSSNPKSRLGSFLAPPEAMFPKTHKRAISAPHVPTFNESPVRTISDRSCSISVVSNTRAFPHTPGGETRASLGTVLQRDVPISPSPTGTPSDDEEPIPVMECLYTANCNTGSQLRKAISHIFGRNKLCTRAIPDNIWVHYCRKHYQRCRYRNAEEWARKSLWLVQEQIDRVQRWSDWNVKHGKPEVLKSWSLTLRKRQRTKLDKKAEKQNGRKRSHPDEYSESEMSDGDMEDAGAPPQWLQDKLGDKKTSEEIKEVLQSIDLRLESGEMKAFPDIEILPDISSNSGSRALTTSRKKPSQQSAHRRSVSSGASLSMSHIEKRQRTDRYQQPFPSVRTHFGNGFHSSPYPVSNYGGFSSSLHTSPSQGPVSGHYSHPESVFASPVGPDGRRNTHQRSISEMVPPGSGAPYGFNLPQVVEHDAPATVERPYQYESQGMPNYSGPFNYNHSQPRYTGYHEGPHLHQYSPGQPGIPPQGPSYSSLKSEHTLAPIHSQTLPDTAARSLAVEAHGPPSDRFGAPRHNRTLSSPAVGYGGYSYGASGFPGGHGFGSARPDAPATSAPEACRPHGCAGPGRTMTLPHRHGNPTSYSSSSQHQARSQFATHGPPGDESGGYPGYPGYSGYPNPAYHAPPRDYEARVPYDGSRR